MMRTFKEIADLIVESGVDVCPLCSLSPCGGASIGACKAGVRQTLEAAAQETAWNCGEDMPKDMEPVIVTIDDGGYRGTAIAHRMGGRWHTASGEADVVAWMPMPEAFKGGDDHDVI